MDISEGYVSDTSFAQQSMWLLHQIDPGKPTYNVIAATRIRGPLRAPELRRALNAVVDRHETLRTVFQLDGDEPVQVVAPSARIPLPVTDVHPSEIDAAVQREVEGPLDLDNGPLLRMRLLRVSPEDHVLTLVMHHVVTDGWSSAIVFRELSHYYEGYVAGGEPELPELPIQYADYAAWQRETLRGERLTKLLDYWRHKLSGADPLRLPIDRARPAVRSNRGETIRFPISEELMGGIEALGRACKATPFMVLLAALQTLFSRQSGQHDITVATAVANRDRAEVAGLIGYFVNTLALRTDLSGNPTVEQLVGRARDTCREAYGHQELPFDKVVETLQPERDGGIGNALVRAMLVLQNMPVEPWRSGELVFEPMDLDNRTALLDLSVLIEAVPTGGHVCMIEYSADLFDRITIERFGETYVRVLAAFVADPGTHVEQIELAGQGERDQLVGEWNTTDRAAPELLVPQQVAAQAARTPTAIAVEHGATSLTYAELDERASSLAAVLRATAAPESLVGVVAEPSVEFAVAVLATLRSGRALLPLDTQLPTARLAQLLDASAVEVVLTQAALADTVAAAGERRVIALDGDWPTEAPTDEAGPYPAGLACVFYTSGSTNLPKGVMFTHDALANFTAAIADELALTPADRYLQLSSIGFDVVLEELLPAWVVGATVVIPTERVLATGGDLTACVTTTRATVVDLTPAYWHEWVRELAERGGAPESLRLAVVGGDRVRTDAVDVWQSFGVDLVEVYGLTEATVTTTTCRLGEHGGGRRGPGVVVGRPLANARLYVLDRWLRPVPSGGVGEVYLGGVGLARGYLGRPGETASRFVADPFGGPGDRLCRTGDLARRRADGEVEFLGRSDDQLKIRGYRVEPAEVEAILARHPGVRQAVVVAPATNGVARLVAHVTPANGALDPAQVRDFAAERAPEYLVPSSVVVRESLPLTPNGKVDRQALLAVAVDAPEPARGPMTPREDRMCGLIGEVLGIERVGVDDDFFAIGGDSIRAIQLASRARAAGVPVTPRDVFTRRTAGRLATVAQNPAAAAAADPDAGIGEVPLTPAVHWLARLGTGKAFNQAVLIRLPAGVRAPLLVEALQAVLDHHDALRMSRTVGADGAWALTIAPRGAVAAADLLTTVPAGQLTEESLAEHARTARAALDPDAGVLCRLVWFDAGDEPGRLLVVLHHLVVDGMSWRILLPDLATAYQLVADGEPIVLDPVGTSFRQWAAGLIVAATDPERTAELGFWRETGRVAEPPLGSRALQPDLDLAATARSFTDTVPVEVAEPLLSGLPVAFHAGANDVLLTGLALAVRHWRARRGHRVGRVLVDVEGHGRDEQVVPGADLSRTVGWFTVAYPVTLDPGEVTWAEVGTAARRVGDALKRVKEQLRGVPGSGVGYGLLRDLNQDTRELLARASTPQIGFNYHGRLGAGADDQVFGWSLDGDTASLGSGLDPDLPLAHPLEVTAVAEERPGGLALTVTWQWASNVLAEEEVRELAGHWLAALTALAGQLDDPTSGGLTPSDLSLMSLSQAELDDLQAGFLD
ncbi:hypothetical protein GCM10027436_81930 [Actinophytocola sediminis]